MKTPCFSLQELAIINRTSRQSSVIAKETLELLCITIEVSRISSICPQYKYDVAYSETSNGLL
jgi:hypothetical protein